MLCKFQKAAFVLFLGQQQSDPEEPCPDLFRVGVSGPYPGGLAVLLLRHGLENLLQFSPRTGRCGGGWCLGTNSR